MKKLLIIDDDADVQDILATLFSNIYDVVFFNDLIPIETVIELNPNLIVLDQKLLSGLGENFCKEIKSNLLINYIPVILFSATNNLQGIANKCGADAHIEKPFDISYLESEIQNLIN